MSILRLIGADLIQQDISASLGMPSAVRGMIIMSASAVNSEKMKQSAVGTPKTADDSESEVPKVVSSAKKSGVG